MRRKREEWGWGEGSWDSAPQHNVLKESFVYSSPDGPVGALSCVSTVTQSWGDIPSCRRWKARQQDSPALQAGFWQIFFRCIFLLTNACYSEVTPTLGNDAASVANVAADGTRNLRRRFSIQRLAVAASQQAAISIRAPVLQANTHRGGCSALRWVQLRRSKQEEEGQKKYEYFLKIGREQPWHGIYQNFCRVIRGESSKMLISFMAFLHSKPAAQTGGKNSLKKCTKQFSVMNKKISESDICLSCRSPVAVAIAQESSSPKLLHQRGPNMQLWLTFGAPSSFTYPFSYLHLNWMSSNLDMVPTRS